MSEQIKFSDNHNHPLHMTDRGRKVAKYAVVAAGGLILLKCATNDFTTSPESHLEKFRNLPSPIVNEMVYEKGPDDSAHIVKSEIAEGDATSQVVEDATIQLAREAGIELKENQGQVINDSAQYIHDYKQATTGGSVQPGDILGTFLDTESGYIISVPLDGNPSK